MNFAALNSAGGFGISANGLASVTPPFSSSVFGPQSTTPSTFGTTPSALGGPAQVATNFRAPTDFASRFSSGNSHTRPNIPAFGSDGGVKVQTSGSPDLNFTFTFINQSNQPTVYFCSHLQILERRKLQVRVALQLQARLQRLWESSAQGGKLYCPSRRGKLSCDSRC